MAGQVGVVLAMQCDGFRHRGAVRPERDRVVAASGERDGECGAPSAASDDGDATQAAAAFDLPKRYSVPAINRRMFAWCFRITMSGMMTQTASRKGVSRP